MRFYYLDLLRAALMVFGIPFHAALPFTGQDWAVSSPEHSIGLTLLATFIHEWRLPTFFFIAGFFASLILGRRSTGEWLRGRVKRLGIPLLSSLVVIIPLQVLLVARINAGGWPGTWAAFAGRMTDFSDFPIGHVWFLLVLLVYCLVLVCLMKMQPSLLNRCRDAAAWLSSSPWRWIGVSAVGGVCAGLMASVWRFVDLSRLFAGLVDEQLALYLPAFALGVIIGSDTASLGRILAWRVPALLVTGSVTTLILVVIELNHLDSAASAVVLRVAGAFGGLVWCVLLLKLAAVLPGSEGGFVRWLVDSSLIVYLVHHSLVILVSASLIGVSGGSPYLIWALTFVSVLVLSGLLYELINCWSTSRFLFTGSRRRGASLFRAGPG